MSAKFSLVLGLLLLPWASRAQTGPIGGGAARLLPAPPGLNGTIMQNAGGSVRLHSTLGSAGLPGPGFPTSDLKVLPGYAGQLYELHRLTLDPPKFAVDEQANRLLQLGGAELHDGTWLNLNAPSAAWSLLNGPLTSVDPGGLARAGIVYQDTPATVQARLLNLTSPLALTVVDVDHDNFGAYAGDGLADDWQVRFFGLDNPEAGPGRDPDSDGQENEFEEVAGVDPTDEDSKFRLRIRRNMEDASWMDIVFSPRWEDREYAVQFATEVDEPFQGTVSGPVNDQGLERVVTDQNTQMPSRFYIIQITRP